MIAEKSTRLRNRRMLASGELGQAAGVAVMPSLILNVSSTLTLTVTIDSSFGSNGGLEFG